MIELRGNYLPVRRLTRTFGFREDVPQKPEDSLVIIVESETAGHVGLLVDTIDDRREVVIKSLDQNLHPIRGLGGATILGDGSIALILDIEALVGPSAPPPRYTVKGLPDASMRVLAQEMKIAIDSLPPDQQGNRAMRVEEDREGLRISLMDTTARSMFRNGSATLTPFARETLARVAARLATSEAQIAIEGHTDGIDTGDAGWRLSGERAIAARAAMIDAGLPAARFAEIVALSNTRPVYPDQPNRPENRRITIVALGEAQVLPSDASFAF